MIYHTGDLELLYIEGLPAWYVYIELPQGKSFWQFIKWDQRGILKV